MIETKRTKPKKKSVVVDFIKALSEKSAKEFQDDISTNKLYEEMKPKKTNEKK